MGLFKRKTSAGRQSPEDRFAAQVLDAVRATGAVAEASVDSEQFAVRFRRINGESGWIYLHNTFRETSRATAAERAHRVQRLVSALVDRQVTDLSWTAVRPQLRPVLRGVAFGQGAPAQMRAPLLSRPALPYLAELIVIDQPTSMAYVTVDRLDEWGVTAEQVFAVARANLTKAARVTNDGGSHGPRLLRFMDDGDGYFTSMLLLDGFLASLASKVGGKPVAFVSDKDTLSVVADNVDALPQFFEMIEKEFAEATRGLSPMAYTVDESGAVIPYAAAGPGDLANAVHRAEVLLATGEYAAQKEALDAQHERDGVDIFVASALVAQRPDRSVFSVSVWADNCDTLLPEADYVGFQSASESLTVPWSVVAAEVGFVPVPGMAPVRYRVTSWPPQPVMDRLRTQATAP